MLEEEQTAQAHCQTRALTVIDGDETVVLTYCTIYSSNISLCSLPLYSRTNTPTALTLQQARQRALVSSTVAVAMRMRCRKLECSMLVEPCFCTTSRKTGQMCKSGGVC